MTVAFLEPQAVHDTNEKGPPKKSESDSLMMNIEVFKYGNQGSNHNVYAAGRVYLHYYITFPNRL